MVERIPQRKAGTGNMARTLVTALIDTYNHERFIEQAIRSVQEQDLPASELEIVVVDDGSTDSTPDIVRKFAPAVRLLRKPNGGQASAFNAAIPEARGEIVAFLDGDDWWAPGKLASVVEIFASDPGVSLVGHGLTQIYPDGRAQTEAPREISRFRIDSVDAAKRFRIRKCFLGTSRMSYRKVLLQRIGPVPQVLTFEADEYLFTLGAFLGEIVILREPLAFYRLHDGNLFQYSNGAMESARRKQQVLASLARCLHEKLREYEVPREIAHTIIEPIQVEADLLRLVTDSGFPWETIAVESRIMRVLHSDASFRQRLFSYARLAPALVMPAAAYYRWKYRLGNLALYQELRRKLLPFPVPKHVERREKPASGAAG
jgi:glycosyltransferase involved in cell wall biosynthesis